MSATDLVWAAGRIWIGGPVRAATRARFYGAERVPAEGGIVVASNHFSWLDPPLVGTSCPRRIQFVAKIEAHRVPGLGQLIRAHGTMAIRRGESDREAVRRMREVVRDGNLLGVFAEGTRQRSGVPGKVQPGAAMVALNENVPVIPAAIHGSQFWKPLNLAPVSIVWGEPVTFQGMPAGSKGYRQASERIEAELRRLWEWLREQHAAGRPRRVTLP